MRHFPKPASSCSVGSLFSEGLLLKVFTGSPVVLIASGVNDLDFDLDLWLRGDWELCCSGTGSILLKLESRYTSVTSMC